MLLNRTSFVVVALGLAGCGDDASSNGSGGAPGGFGTGAGVVGGSGNGPAGGAGGIGGNSGGTAQGGNGGDDLGWPYGDTVPTPCAEDIPPTSGTPWTGWANVQFPNSATIGQGASTPSMYGQVFASGQTNGAGMAAGWESQLALGPYGTTPVSTSGRCWQHVAASFNVDVGNNDEYVATATPPQRGLFGALYRYRPGGGAWRYGDLDGSDNGATAEQASLVHVTSAADGAPLIVVTLNLRCRLDDWPARAPLVTRALARIDPDLIAFQEDCNDAQGRPQSDEIRNDLSAHTGRGYDLRRQTTHLANDMYEEGISVLSAFPISSSSTLDLPYENFPRKALSIDIDIAGTALRFYSTHFDYGASSSDERQASALAILADLDPTRRTIVAGDLNAEPTDPGPSDLVNALSDGWSNANPSQTGLTMPADGPQRRIDYVFIDPALASGLSGAKLLDESEGGTLLSDHLGVGVAIELR